MTDKELLTNFLGWQCRLRFHSVPRNTSFNGEIFRNVKENDRLRQESPPAWTQEAYRPPCSEYSFCCPTWVPPRGGTRTPPGGVPSQVPPRGGTQTPQGGTQSGTPPGGKGYWSGTPPGGYPDPLGGTQSGTPPGGYPVRYPPWGGYPDPPGGYPVRYPPGGVPGQVPPHCLMAFWEMLQSIMGYGYPPLWTDRLMDGQTRVKTLPSLVLRTRAVMKDCLSDHCVIPWFTTS